MRGQMTHWESRNWRDNLDELVADPDRPQAVPASVPTDLMGRIRVRLCAEDASLVAYGFGGQRIVIPASSVGAVRTVDAYRLGSRSCGRALLVFNHQGWLLLRAGGLWETYGEVAKVCQAAGVPSPTHVTYSARRSRRSRRSRGSGRHVQQQPPLYPEAVGCRKLRVVPRGNSVRMLAKIAIFLFLLGLGAFVGTIPALVLPQWVGAVRVLLGIAGALLGATGGVWLFTAGSHGITNSLRWLMASRMARTLAPPDRFFRREKRPARRSSLLTACMVLLVPALIGWGPGVGIATLAHGLRDSSLVAELRAQGVSTFGFLVDVPTYSTDQNGGTTVTDVATLAFLPGKQRDLWETTDPSIGGRPLPLNQANPAATRELITVVYVPADPDIAAAKQQIEGSVWHGAPTANMIVGSLFTLALPLLIWRLVFRLRRRRWLRDGALFDELEPTAP